MSQPLFIEEVTKRYGDFTAIDRVSISIDKGEFFTLLGPSGCGKTTLLRMIAGFNSIEAGTIRFGQTVINSIPAYKRNAGMVFQNYAIFPHLSVYDNVAYGLKARGYSKAEIEKDVEEVLGLVKMSEYKDRQPSQLSGGQQQRIALARAIVIKPDVLLMDEPLSNLDAKLRIEMRSVIKKIQQNLNITTVYVTHDQEEAMAVSDRIAVMNEGDIQQIGIPKALYQRPANLFVASFIGLTNLINSRLEVAGGKTFIYLPGEHKVELHTIRKEERKDQDVVLSIRPEELYVKPFGEEGVPAYVDHAVFLGLNTHYIIHFENGERAEIIQESQIDSIIEKGTKISLGVKTDKINVFDAEGNRNLVEGVVNDLDAYNGAR